MILSYGGLNGCFKYNPHPYLSRGGSNIVSFVRDGQSSTL